MVKQKGFKDYLNDDPSLTEKITYEEFINSQKATGIKDDGVEEAYNGYLKVLEALEATDNKSWNHAFKGGRNLDKFQQYRSELIEEMIKLGATENEINLISDILIQNAIKNNRSAKDVAWAILQ